MKIKILPQAVVDRIAAGEVVQRPAAAVKEMVENCLDAGATEVQVQTDGMEKLVISDNGCGIAKEDLALAAVRHATSKLTTAEDLSSIQSFGFRGEALASISMVSRLSIVSRTKDRPAAYKLSYLDGKPTTAIPVPTARTPGTTVTVQDLFYNMPNRRKMKPSEEYNHILKVLQLYAIHYAHAGVAIHCQKLGGKGNNASSKTDLNSSTSIGSLRSLLSDKTSSKQTDKCEELRAAQLDATKQVISQVFGSQLLPHLKHLDCKMSAKEHRKKSNVENAGIVDGTDNENNEFIYTCNAVLTSPSYQSMKRTQFILFVNNRLVDGCSALKRTIDDVYAEYTKSKPFIYLSLEVPANQVDVNVHPTKKEVALLYLDDICNDIASQLKEHLSAQGQTFLSQTLDLSIENPYASSAKKRKQTSLLDTSITRTFTHSETQSNTTVSQKETKVRANKLIRTSRGTQSGSLEPFLMSTQQLSQKGASVIPTQESPSSTGCSATSEVKTQQSPTESSTIQTQTKHKLNCPFLRASPDLDLSQPGAFASIASKCTCNRNEDDGVSPAGTIRLPRQALCKPKRIPPIPCIYKSIQQLRKRVQKQASLVWQKKLRSACFVGIVSHCRSLIQCGEELVMLNHYECMRELFYQLALNRFKSGDQALLEQDIDVVIVVSQVVQIEEMIHDPVCRKELESCQSVQVSEVNQNLAEQAAECLLNNADMLREYFSVFIEKIDNNRIVLKGLPLLLEGYEPSPHGLPLFLLRLATEVDWTEEKPCFHGVCRELGAYYAQLPSGDDHASVVRHTIFPAVSTLLVPSQTLVESKDLMTMASLSALFKVFERC